MKKIKILVIDDSSIVHMLIEKSISLYDDIEIVGEAYDGETGLVMLNKLDIDVIILDIGLPKMSGLDVLREIMILKPLPVIIFSAVNKNEVNVSFKALELGAVEIIEKPEATDLLDFKNKMEGSLVKSIRMFSDFRVAKRTNFEEKPHIHTIIEHHKTEHDTISTTSKEAFPVVIIASSTGGPQTLKILLTNLSKRDLNASVVIVQHMAEGFMPGFCEWLSLSSSMPMYLPKNGESMKTNSIYVAPGEFHLTFGKNEHFAFLDQPPIMGIRPSADILIESSAKIFKDRVISVILTGMGSDGTEGIKAVKDFGGTVIAQDEKSSIIFGMPKSAIESGCVDHIANINNIGELIEDCCNKWNRSKLQL